MDVETGRARPVRTDPFGQLTAPQWSADGNSLHYVRLPTGTVTVDVRSGEVTETPLNMAQSGVATRSRPGFGRPDQRRPGSRSDQPPAGRNPRPTPRGASLGRSEFGPDGRVALGGGAFGALVILSSTEAPPTRYRGQRPSSRVGARQSAVLRGRRVRIAAHNPHSYGSVHRW